MEAEALVALKRTRYSQTCCRLSAECRLFVCAALVVGVSPQPSHIPLLFPMREERLQWISEDSICFSVLLGTIFDDSTCKVMESAPDFRMVSNCDAV